MHEIINLSLSHRSNHLTTQFYNCLEPLLHDQDHDNEVFFRQTVDKISKSVSYSPRVLLWDAKLGNGSLGTYQYTSEKDYVEDVKHQRAPQDNKNTETVQTHGRIRRSPYQIALDEGSKLPQLTDEMAVYWSDYSKLIYDPTSFNFLKDWYHDADHQAAAPNFQNLHQVSFDRYETGVCEFKDNYSDEFFDVNLHQQLESCDTLQGFNIITELDNGWGGFSSALLLDLKDELPKASYITYGWNQDDVVSLHQPIHSTKTKFRTLCTKIRSTVNLIEESDLFVPLYAKQNEAFWESTGEVAVLFESINSLFHGERSSTDVKKMLHLINLLNLGDSSRNVVSKLNVDHYESFSFYERMPHYKTTNLPSFTFSHCEIDRTGDSKQTLSLLHSYKWNNCDTIPPNYNDCEHVSLGVTEKCRDVFKTWEDLVSRYFRYDSDREELKDSLGNLSLEYENGWYDDEDASDSGF